MSKRRLRAGDTVVVIAGNDRGKTGKILAFRGRGVVVEGINVRKKHVKKNQQNPSQTIISIECPVHISNVMPYVEGLGAKLRVRWDDKQEKVLYVQQGERNVDYRPAHKAKS